MKDTNNQPKAAKKLKLALLCGGPSLERGISLNSARSVLDHLQGDTIDITPFYFNQKKEAFALSPAQLYSNTPADFDFKLTETAQALNESQLETQLKRADIVFPVIHGSFGEDGVIQKWLEDRGIPYVGSSSVACKLGFDKFRANGFIRDKGFFTIPSCLLRIYNDAGNAQAIKDFFTQHSLTRAIVKPAAGGSSIGVFSVSTPKEAIEKAKLIFSKRMDTRVVLEPFVNGREFTVMVLQSRCNLPVAILPTEIEADYMEHQIFDFRKKYLPTRHVSYHCPPRFDDHVIERIQLQAEQLFMQLGMADFARFDGWVLEDGSIWFADFNPISGMEQNSFLFQQAARIGLSHKAVLEHVIMRACERQNIKHPLTDDTSAPEPDTDHREPLAVLMGGMTSERQVSLMSGTNVWLKLRNSTKFRPIPYLMDLDGSVWKVPYQLLLNHTVEEIIHNCLSAASDEARIHRFERYARERLGFYASADQHDFGKPEKLSLAQLIERHKHIFIALHGGMGEDGRLQAILEGQGSLFNGPSSAASKICADKQVTAEAIDGLALAGVSAIRGLSLPMSDLQARSNKDVQRLWNDLRVATGGRTFIAKPVADGCSSGVVRLYDQRDLAQYISLMSQGGSIPAHTFRDQIEQIELPLEIPESVRFEKYVGTDIIRVKASKLIHSVKSNLVEITIGVIEKNGSMHALNPSITVAEGDVLSVEEKFQGGTGINLTPPPESIMAKSIRQGVQRKMEAITRQLDIHGYCRIDAFVNCQTGELLIIEINSLPGLTASTVIFQQGLAETPAIYPREFLELIAENKYLASP